MTTEETFWNASLTSPRISALPALSIVVLPVSSAGAEWVTESQKQKTSTPRQVPRRHRRRGVGHLRRRDRRRLGRRPGSVSAGRFMAAWASPLLRQPGRYG